MNSEHLYRTALRQKPAENAKSAKKMIVSIVMMNATHLPTVHADSIRQENTADLVMAIFGFGHILNYLVKHGSQVSVTPLCC